MSEARKRVSHTLAALQKQIAEEEARAKETPLDGFEDTFSLDFLKKLQEAKGDD